MIKIRSKLRKGDDKRLLRLEKDSPMRGVVTIYYDHSPSYFNYFKLFGKLKPYFLEIDGELAAFTNGSVFKLIHEGKPLEVIIFTNLRTNPKFKGQGLGSRVATFAFNDSKKDYPVVGGFIMKSNAAAVRLSKKYPFTKFKYKGLILHQLLPFKNYKLSGDYEIRQAKKKEIKKLLSYYYKHNYLMYPQKVFRKLPGYDENNIKVAVKDGEVVACLGLWDQGSVKKVIVIDYSLKISLLKFFLRFFKGLPRIPKKGNSIRLVHFKHAGFKPGHEQAMSDLIANALNYCKKNGYLMAVTAAFPDDPLNELYNEFLGLRTKVLMGLYSDKKIKLDKPLFIDTSML